MLLNKPLRATKALWQRSFIAKRCKVATTSLVNFLLLSFEVTFFYLADCRYELSADFGIRKLYEAENSRKGWLGNLLTVFSKIF